MREEKKYEILPGVEIPDIKKIQEAASDFSISEVGDVEIKTVTLQPVIEPIAPGVSAEELSNLQSLGVKVAEDEERSKAVSRAKMDAIMNKAVQAPESIGDLKASHIAQLNDEKRKKQLEDEMKEAEAQKAEEDAKNKAREERRQLQQRLLEESKERLLKRRKPRKRLQRKLQQMKKRSSRELLRRWLPSLCSPLKKRKKKQLRRKMLLKQRRLRQRLIRKKSRLRLKRLPRQKRRSLRKLRNLRRDLLHLMRFRSRRKLQRFYPLLKPMTNSRNSWKRNNIYLNSNDGVSQMGHSVLILFV